RRERTPDDLSAVLPCLAGGLPRECPKYFRPRGRRCLHAPARYYAAPLDACHGSVHESDVHLLLPRRRSLRLSMDPLRAQATFVARQRAPLLHRLVEVWAGAALR